MWPLVKYFDYFEYNLLKEHLLKEQIIINLSACHY